MSKIDTFELMTALAYVVGEAMAVEAKKKRAAKEALERPPPWLLALQEKIQQALPQDLADEYMRDIAVAQPGWLRGDPRWRRVEYSVRAVILDVAGYHGATYHEGTVTFESMPHQPPVVKRAKELCRSVAEGQEPSESQWHQLSVRATLPAYSNPLTSWECARIVAQLASSKAHDATAAMAYHASLAAARDTGGPHRGLQSMEETEREQRQKKRIAWRMVVEGVISALQLEQVRAMESDVPEDEPATEAP